jgi:hypothetical protein
VISIVGTGRSSNRSAGDAPPPERAADLDVLAGRPGLDPGTLGLKVRVKPLRPVSRRRTASQNGWRRSQIRAFAETGCDRVRRIATHLLGQRALPRGNGIPCHAECIPNTTPRDRARPTSWRCVRRGSSLALPRPTQVFRPRLASLDFDRQCGSKSLPSLVCRPPGGEMEPHMMASR